MLCLPRLHGGLGVKDLVRILFPEKTKTWESIVSTGIANRYRYQIAMLKWAINRAKERNAHLLQLTTDKKRPKAIKFYEDLGFKATHEGMKIHFE